MTVIRIIYFESITTGNTTNLPEYSLLKFRVINTVTVMSWIKAIKTQPLVYYTVFT